jgi:hypothetical protein
MHHSVVVCMSVVQAVANARTNMQNVRDASALAQSAYYI